MNGSTLRANGFGLVTARWMWVPLACACVSLTGCEQLLNAAVEEPASETVANPVKQRVRDAAYGLFETANESCPEKISDHTTLMSVKNIGLNRFRYEYVVSESGRSTINLNHKLAVRREVVERTLKSPMAAAIVALDLGVEHVYKDTDGKQMLSFSVTRNELSAVHLDDATDGGDHPAAVPLPEQLGPTSRTKDNPTGIQVNPYAD